MGLISRVSSRTYRVTKMSHNNSGESRRLDYEARVRSRWEPPVLPQANTQPTTQAANNMPKSTEPVTKNTPISSPTSTEFNDNTPPAGIITSPTKSPQKT